MALTEQQESAYIQSCGATCPYCGCPKIDLKDEGKSNELGYCVELTCCNCFSQWQDIYALVAIKEKFDA